MNMPAIPISAVKMSAAAVITVSLSFVEHVTLANVVNMVAATTARPATILATTVSYAPPVIIALVTITSTLAPRDHPKASLVQQHATCAQKVRPEHINESGYVKAMND
jgi:hypothetical protein